MDFFFFFRQQRGLVKSGTASPEIGPLVSLGLNPIHSKNFLFFSGKAIEVHN